MIADLKPYPKMKDSGVPWLEEVPEHWEVNRAKNLFQCIDVRSETGEEELLTVSSKHGVVPRRTTSVTMFKAESYTGHKLCWPGDLVINSLWAWAQGLGVSRNHGIVSTAYGVYRSRMGVDINPQFVHNLVRSKPFHWELRVRSKGVWTSRLQLTDESFLGAPFPIPTLLEQNAIVRFLDYADRRISRYIRAKRKLIKLLEEQKQAIIHKAVTCGLDPNVRLKPSGVEWLGDIPEHWVKKRLKQVSVVQTGITLGKGYTSTTLIERPYMRVANVQSGRLDLSKVTTVRVPSEEIERSTLQKGDVLMTEGGDIDKLGRGCVWNEEIPECLHQNHIFAVRPQRAGLLPDFLVALIGSRQGRNYFQVTAKQTTNLAATNSTTLGNFPLLLPCVEEQERIISMISELSIPLKTAIASAQREIVLLREYRTRLIADVVTGKLDVREVAERLPDETNEPEPLDNLEALAEGDEEGEGSELELAPEEAEG